MDSSTLIKLIDTLKEKKSITLDYLYEKVTEEDIIGIVKSALDLQDIETKLDAFQFVLDYQSKTELTEDDDMVVYIRGLEE